MKEIPKDITLRFKEIFPKEEYKEVKKVFTLTKRPVSFRVNKQRASCNEIESILTKNNILFERVDILTNSYVLDTKHTEKDLWNLDIYKVGKIYLQSLSSQLPVHFFSDDESFDGNILDACAAPGGKTSQLSAKYPNARIYAFEPSKIRYEKLLYTLKKQGCSNVRVFIDTVQNISNHVEKKILFDKILVDAPCSSEGSILSSNTKFLENWSEAYIKNNYKRQKNIVSAIIPYLGEDGELIYSTCTIAPEENENIAHYVISNFKNLYLENIDLHKNTFIKPILGLKSFKKLIFNKQVSEKTLRVVPSVFSEGFYIAKFKKGIDL